MSIDILLRHHLGHYRLNAANPPAIVAGTYRKSLLFVSAENRYYSDQDSSGNFQPTLIANAALVSIRLTDRPSPSVG